MNLLADVLSQYSNIQATDSIVRLHYEEKNPKKTPPTLEIKYLIIHENHSETHPFEYYHI